MLKNKRLALVCHPASVNHELEHSFDLIHEAFGLSCAFGPQHGVKGDKQYNMKETEDEVDQKTGVPLFSLYGKVRKPTREMLAHADVVLYDLQDLGCRIYTFATTLLYTMEACSEFGKSLIILDRPNPAGRAVEGFCLEPGWESFVGAAPIPMRHGLTLGELALYYKDHFALNTLDLQIVPMKSYSLQKSPGFGWPQDLAWVNPSPNAASLNMARAYPGTVFLEGTNLSEGRGTTRPLEMVGAPELKMDKVLLEMKKLDLPGAKSWLKGTKLRSCFFAPTFYKYQDNLCNALALHYDFADYDPSIAKPFRVMALLFKALRSVHPEYDLYRNFVYEYVADKLPFDVINGGPKLREWIENPKAHLKDLESALSLDEKAWRKTSQKYWLYKN